MSVLAEVRRCKGQYITSGSLYSRLVNLTQRHAMPPICAFRIVSNPRNPAYPLVKAVFQSGSEKTLCVRSKKQSLIGKEARRKAMRDAVSEEMAEFKGKRCKVCGSTDDLTVDHIRPFRDIADEFEQTKQKWPKSFYKDTTRVRFYREDEDWLREWQEFHRRKSEFQTLCRSCNSSKGVEHWPLSQE